MSSLDSPALKRTTGTPVLASSASSSATSRSWLRLSRAGDGMVPPPVEQELDQPELVLDARDVAADPMRSTEVQRKLTCSSSSLATVPMAASSPTVAAVDQQFLTGEDVMGTLAFSADGGGHRAGFAGPAPIQREPGRPAASELRPSWRSTTVS